MIKKLTKHSITTSTRKGSKDWYRIRIDGIKTRYEVNIDGIVRDRETGGIVKEQNDRYITFKLWVPEINPTKPLTVFKHRLMASIFIPVPRKYLNVGYTPDSLFPDHKDGNKHNNDLSNLEWVTPKENTIRAFDNGLCNNISGENSHLAKTSEADIIRVCELLEEGLPIKKISEMTGVGEKIIRHVFSGETWKRISKDYDFRKNREIKKIPYKLTDETIHMICMDLEKRASMLRDKEQGIPIDEDDFKTNYTFTAIGERYGTDRRYVSDIWYHKVRKTISCEYNF